MAIASVPRRASGVDHCKDARTRGLKLRVALATTTMSFCTGGAAFGQTMVPGGAVQGKWDSGGSPYIVCGDIEVEQGTTLQICPGVEVRFASSTGLTIEGNA